MSSSSHGGLSVSKGKQFRPTLPMGVRNSFVEVKLCKTCKNALEQAGLPTKDYAGHSFRIGAATMAAVASLEDSAIQILGQWESCAFKRYIRLDPWGFYHLNIGSLSAIAMTTQFIHTVEN